MAHRSIHWLLGFSAKIELHAYVLSWIELHAGLYEPLLDGFPPEMSRATTAIDNVARGEGLLAECAYLNRSYRIFGEIMLENGTLSQAQRPHRPVKPTKVF